MSLESAAKDFDDELKQLYSSKEYEACLEKCKEVLTRNPLHLQALLYMADISLNQRKLEDCVRYCDTVIQGIEDRISYVWSWRGQALCLLKRYKDAEESLFQAIKYDPSDTANWSFLAITIFVKGEKERAMGILDLVEEKLEKPGKFALVRGYIERADGNTDEALMQFIQGGLNADPNTEDYDENRELYAKEVKDTLKKG